MKKKNIVILGSTGSIGVSTLNVIRRYPGKFRVLGLSARSSLGLLERQVREFRPEHICVGEEKDTAVLGRKYGRKAGVYSGTGGLEKLASLRAADTVLIAVVGSAGLYPLVSAVKAGKTIALANKESLVAAGGIVSRLARKHGARIIPVDSEHSAIFQCMNGGNTAGVARIIITASGGPFFGRKVSFDRVTVRQALNHPRWNMGKKITVDSATMMNKGLEIIEAHHLFKMPLGRISMLIHPQSIVHSMVEFSDGAVMGLLSEPDMRLSIQYALTYPERTGSGIRRLSLEKVSRLDFYKPDFGRFPCLALALTAAGKGGTMPAVLNAADEAAVKGFLDGEIRFSAIPVLIEKVMKKHRNIKKPSLGHIIDSDAWAREEVKRMI